MRITILIEEHEADEYSLARQGSPLQKLLGAIYQHVPLGTNLDLSYLIASYSSISEEEGAVIKLIKDAGGDPGTSVHYYG